MTSACEPWPIVWPCNPLDQGSQEQIDAALSAAQSMLWARTGRRHGTCTVTEKYRPAGGGECGRPYMTDDLVWHNGGRGGPCCAINLVSLPVQHVVDVREFGQVLPETAWWLESPGLLMRRGSCWPVALSCDPAPVEVTYQWGVPIVAPVDAVAADPDGEPPVVGVDAVPGSELWGMVAAAMGEVTVEVMHAMCGRPCKLPSRAITITRQGVTVQLADPTTTLESRLLGLPLADALILTVNPNRKQARSRVYSPDMAIRA